MKRSEVPCQAANWGAKELQSLDDETFMDEFFVNLVVNEIQLDHSNKNNVLW